MIMVLRGVAMDDARNIVEKVRSLIDEHIFAFQGQSLSVTLSLGLAKFDASQDDDEKIIKKADEALYQAKKLGRNCFVVF